MLNKTMESYVPPSFYNIEMKVFTNNYPGKKTLESLNFQIGL